MPGAVALPVMAAGVVAMVVEVAGLVATVVAVAGAAPTGAKLTIALNPLGRVLGPARYR